jgi:hypothetical protein
VTTGVRWPVVIIGTVAGLAAAQILSPGEPAAVAFTLLFLLFCPGMAFVGMLGLRDPWVCMTAAVALSIGLDVAVAATLVYSGAWSPTVALLVLTAISLFGAGLQISLEPRKAGTA